MAVSRIIRFPGAPDPADGESPPEAPPLVLDAEARHQLEVRLDVARERVLLWRIAVVFAALAALLLVRQLFVG